MEKQTVYIQDQELIDLIKDGERQFPAHDNSDLKIKLELTGDAEQVLEQSIKELI